MATTGDKIWELTNADQSSTSLVPAGHKVRIQRVEWHPNAVDDDLDLEDENGLTILKARAKIPSGTTHDEIGAITRDFGLGRDFVGFIPTTIDGGTVYVYLV